MSIFITHLAFVDETIIAAVKLGVFAASFIAAIIGVTLNYVKKEKAVNTLFSVKITILFS